MTLLSASLSVVTELSASLPVVTFASSILTVVTESVARLLGPSVVYLSPTPVTVESATKTVLLAPGARLLREFKASPTRSSPTAVI